MKTRCYRLLASLATLLLVVGSSAVELGAQTITARLDTITVPPNKLGQPSPIELDGLLTNTGDAELVIRELSIGGEHAEEFFIGPDTNLPARLAPGDSLDITIVAIATEIGPRFATLIVASNAENEPIFEVPIVGTGATPVLMGLDVDFGRVADGNVGDTLVPVAFNPGILPVVVHELTIKASDFRIVDQPAIPLSIDPSDTLFLRLQFLPITDSLRIDTLVIDSDASNSPLEITLTGDARTSSVSAEPQAEIGVYPTVVRDRMTIRVAVEETALRRSTTIAIVDGLGRAVRTWDDQESLIAGELLWDGTDDLGSAVPAGAYRVVVQTGDVVRTVGIVRR